MSQGLLFFFATVADDAVTKLNSMLTVPQILPTSPDQTTRWQAKLEAAQNVIFCKELFTQVSSYLS